MQVGAAKGPAGKGPDMTALITFTEFAGGGVAAFWIYSWALRVRTSGAF